MSEVVESHAILIRPEKLARFLDVALSEGVDVSALFVGPPRNDTVLAWQSFRRREDISRYRHYWLKVVESQHELGCKSHYAGVIGTCSVLSNRFTLLLATFHGSPSTIQAMLDEMKARLEAHYHAVLN